MSRVIVVCGQAGVGKTTLSLELSRRLNIFCIHKDSIKERLYELLGGNSLEESQHTGMLSMELLFHLAEETIRNGVNVMIESPFNHSSNPGTFTRWRDQLLADVKILACELHDKEEHVRRFHNRDRHYAHRDFARNWLPTGFDVSVFPEPKIILDMSQPLEVNINRAIHFLKNS